MDWTMALFILSSVAGIIMVIGSLFLLYKGRIYLDSEGKSVSQVELPLGIKFSTQFPVLVMFLFGAFLLIFPIHYAKNICPDLSLHSKVFPQMVTVKGKVISKDVKDRIDVYAIVDEQSNAHDEVILNVPFRLNGRYQIMYSTNNRVLDSVPFMLEKPDQPITLRDVAVQSSMQSIAPPLELSAPQIKATQDQIANFK
ncbi:MAG TPA: hypothetical protein VF708_07850 [Pyrinomonadaceae bacterium]|jgi:hypothetical protein